MDNLEAMVTRHDEQIKVANHRIDDLEAVTKNIYDLNFSVKQILLEIQEMKQSQSDSNSNLAQAVKELTNRIDLIEKEPVKNIKDLKSKALSTIVNTLIGALIAGIFAISVYFIKLN